MATRNWQWLDIAAAVADHGGMQPILATWTHTVAKDGGGPVYPDGCRDVVLVRRPGAAPELLVSPIDMTPRWISSDRGTEFWGLRMMPGASVDAAILKGLSEAPPDVIAQRAAESLRQPAQIAEAIDALAEYGATVASACRHCGVSRRSMERLMQRHNQPAPSVWLQLARVRRAVHLLARRDDPIAAIAAEAGYSDQPHMTRALRHWFATSPAALRKDTALQDRLCQPGLGTGEQISIR